MKITVHSEEELLNLCKELLHITVNLRAATKLWEQHYGCALRNKKKYYEARADELIERLQVTDHKHSHDIKIDISNPEP